MKVRVVKKEKEAVDIFRFELAAVDGHPLPAFSAGAHIDVHVDENTVRQYSLCNHPDEVHRYVIGVLRDPGSRGGSEAMHRDVEEGDVLTISEPRNHFPLVRGARRSILIVGGIGVTPILCMAQRLAHLNAHFDMHYCARSAERMAFRSLLEAAPFAKQVSLHFDDGDDAQKFDVSVALGAPEQGTHIYVCGPTGFMEWMIGMARSLGWPDEAIHREYFSGAAVDTTSDKGFDVKLASSGETIAVFAGETVVAALARCGVEIPVSCEQGVCGTCLTRVLDGEPDDRDVFLTDADHVANDRFAPCCSRSRSRLLVLDL